MFVVWRHFILCIHPHTLTPRGDAPPAFFVAKDLTAKDQQHTANKQYVTVFLCLRVPACPFFLGYVL